MGVVHTSHACVCGGVKGQFVGLSSFFWPRGFHIFRLLGEHLSLLNYLTGLTPTPRVCIFVSGCFLHEAWNFVWYLCLASVHPGVTACRDHNLWFWVFRMLHFGGRTYHFFFLTSFCSSSAPVFQSLHSLTSVYLGTDTLIVLTSHTWLFPPSG